MGSVFLESLPPSPVITDGAAGAEFLAGRLRALERQAGGLRASNRLPSMRVLALDAATEACSVALHRRHRR